MHALANCTKTAWENRAAMAFVATEELHLRHTLGMSRSWELCFFWITKRFPPFPNSFGRPEGIPRH